MSIDKILRQSYKNRKYNELQAIYELANQEVCKAIKEELEKSLRHCSTFDQVIYVDHQWIDKIPLAQFVENQVDINGNKIASKVEIGDIFIQFRHSNAFTRPSENVFRTYLKRSAVIQAKISNELFPTVPIAKINSNRSNSTTKELRLLEHWPRFNLYETSRSKMSLIDNIDVKPSDKIKAFYGGFFNSEKMWRFGEAKYNQKCDISYSELMLGICSGVYGKDLGTEDSSWTSLSEHIESITSNRKIPKWISKKRESRNKTISVKFYSFPYLDLEWIINLITKKKLLVLMIDQIDFEGDDIKKLKM